MSSSYSIRNVYVSCTSSTSCESRVKASCHVDDVISLSDCFHLLQNIMFTVRKRCVIILLFILYKQLKECFCNGIYNLDFMYQCYNNMVITVSLKQIPEGGVLSRLVSSLLQYFIELWTVLVNSSFIPAVCGLVGDRIFSAEK